MRERSLALAVLFGIAALQPAWADRAPTREEQRVIEAVLKVEGFLRWEHIELDGDEWEVEGAVAADARRYDLRLDARTLEIVERHRD
jgi:uncharacterized membrane protein YkoI